MSRTINLPEVFKARTQQGAMVRVIDGVLDHGNKPSGHLLEDVYNKNREAFEKLRGAHPDTFMHIVRHMAGTTKLTTTLLAKHGPIAKQYGIDAGNTSQIATAEEWSKAGFMPTHQAEFRFDINGNACVRSHYMGVAGCVENFRKNEGRFIDDLDTLLRTGTHRDLVSAEQWFEQRNSAPERKGMGRSFEQAIRRHGITSLDLPAAKKFIELNKPEPAGVA